MNHAEERIVPFLLGAGVPAGLLRSGLPGAAALQNLLELRHVLLALDQGDAPVVAGPEHEDVQLDGGERHLVRLLAGLGLPRVGLSLQLLLERLFHCLLERLGVGELLDVPFLLDLLELALHLVHGALDGVRVPVHHLFPVRLLDLLLGRGDRKAQVVEALVAPVLEVEGVGVGGQRGTDLLERRQILPGELSFLDRLGGHLVAVEDRRLLHEADPVANRLDGGLRSGHFLELLARVSDGLEAADREDDLAGGVVSLGLDETVPRVDREDEDDALEDRLVGLEELVGVLEHLRVDREADAPLLVEVNLDQLVLHARPRLEARDGRADDHSVLEARGAPGQLVGPKVGTRDLDDVVHELPLDNLPGGGVEVESDALENLEGCFDPFEQLCCHSGKPPRTDTARCGMWARSGQKLRVENYSRPQQKRQNAALTATGNNSPNYQKSILNYD